MKVRKEMLPEQCSVPELGTVIKGLNTEHLHLSLYDQWDPQEKFNKVGTAKQESQKTQERH
jgi:hypothetical protein